MLFEQDIAFCAFLWYYMQSMDYEKFKGIYSESRLTEGFEAHPNPTPEAWRRHFDSVIHATLDPNLNESQKNELNRNVGRYIEWVDAYYPNDEIVEHCNQQDIILSSEFNQTEFWQTHYHTLNTIMCAEVPRFLGLEDPRLGTPMMTMREAYLSAAGAQHFATFMNLRCIADTLNHEIGMGKHSDNIDEVKQKIKEIRSALPIIAGAANEIDFCLGVTKFQKNNKKWHIFVAPPLFEADSENHNADFFLAKPERDDKPADIIPIQVKTTPLYDRDKYSDTIRVISMRHDFGNELGIRPHHYTTSVETRSAAGLFSATNLKHNVKTRELIKAHSQFNKERPEEVLTALSRGRHVSAEHIVGCKDYSKRVSQLFQSIVETSQT